LNVAVDRRSGVRRERLLADLGAHADVPVIVLVGGAGYGKTVLLDQWCEEQGRPVARVQLRPRHDDGTALLGIILDALHEIEPVPTPARRRIVSGDLDWSSVILPEFGRLLARRTVAFALVLDDTQFLQADRAVAVLDVLVHGLPAGWQLLLASRTDPDLGLARLEAGGRVWSVDPARLLMTAAESAELLHLMDVGLDRAELDAVIARCEGWPLALHLSGVARRVGDDPGGPDVEFAGDDLALARYLRDEVLERLDPEVRSFLLRTSILEELDPALCDSMLGRDDSYAVLRDLAAGHTLVRPAGRSGDRYRVPRLLRDLLRTELQREEPVLTPALHRHASEWYTAAGDHAAAVEHALATDDDAYVDSVVWSLAVPYLGGGLDDTVRSWLDAYPHAVKCGRPTLAVVSAWHALIVGDTASVRVWTDIIASFDADLVLPDASSVPAAAALLRALLALDGIATMLSDVELAREGHAPTSPMWSMVLILQGYALRLLGRDAEAARILHEAVALGLLVNVSGSCHGRAGLARLAAASGDWDRCGALVDENLAVMEEHGFDTRPAMAGPYALAGLVYARRGDRVAAERFSKQAAFLVGMLVDLGPWMVVETCLDLARTALLLGDPVHARALLDEARHKEQYAADSPVLLARMAELETTLDAQAMPLGLHASAMTPAELRVLRYLPTHLTFGAIADELFVSRNTVKTQAIAIYRKLGVSSRDAAVAEARRLQLLD
jgi:LuxR family maltose regulon positive regulatory protein